MTRDLGQTRDRITKLLTKQSQPTGGVIQKLGDIGSAYLSALSTGGGAAGFEQAYQTGQQARQQQVQSQLEPQMQLYKMMKDEVAQGNKEAAAVDKAIKNITGDDLTGYQEIATRLHTAAKPIGSHNAVSEALRVASEIGYKSPKQRKTELELKKLEAEVAPPQAFDPSTGQPIPSGLYGKEYQKAKAKAEAKLDVKRQENYSKARSAIQGFKSQSKVVTDNIDKAIKTINPWSTGYGSWLSWLPDTDARKLKNYLDTIRANVGFDKLQQMRESSPTGGALGQVSEMENKLLQAVNGALDPGQADQLKENLTIIKDLYPQVLTQKEEAFSIDYGEGQPQAQRPAQKRIRRFNPTTGTLE